MKVLRLHLGGFVDLSRMSAAGHSHRAARLLGLVALVMMGCDAVVDLSGSRSGIVAHQAQWPKMLELLEGDSAVACPAVNACAIVASSACVCSIEGISVNVPGGDGNPGLPPLWTEPPGFPDPDFGSWPEPPGGGSWPTLPDPGPGECDPNGLTNSCFFTATVSCSTLVTRGEYGECTLSIEPWDALDFVRVWTFNSATVNASYGVNTTTWGGTLVESGDVRVEFRARGRDMTAASQIKVVSRNWSWGAGDWQFSPGQAPQPAGGGVTQPLYGGDLLGGWHCAMPSQDGCGVKRFMRPDYDQGETGGFTISPVISSGPNTGAYYVSGASFYSSMGSAVNPYLTSSSATQYTSTMPQQSGCSPMNWYAANDCLQGASSQAFVSGIMNHEGYGSTGTNGHQSFYESEAGKPDYDPMMAVEGMVGTSQTALTTNARNVVNQRSALLKQVVDAKGEPSGNFNAAVRWLWDIVNHFWQLELLNGG